MFNWQPFYPLDENKRSFRKMFGKSKKTNPAKTDFTIPSHLEVKKTQNTTPVAPKPGSKVPAKQKHIPIWLVLLMLAGAIKLISLVTSSSDTEPGGVTEQPNHPIQLTQGQINAIRQAKSNQQKIFEGSIKDSQKFDIWEACHNDPNPSICEYNKRQQ